MRPLQPAKIGKDCVDLSLQSGKCPKREVHSPKIWRAGRETFSRFPLLKYYQYNKTICEICMFNVTKDYAQTGVALRSRGT
jgi:hypothetical protein